MLPFLKPSNYDYHFIIKELANGFEGQFECLAEKKYKAFSVPVEKEVINIDKDGNKSVVTISYKIKIYWECKIYGKFIMKFCE